MNELKELVQRLENAFSDRLVSVILYGSAAAGDHHTNFSDLNILCVLKQITPRELAEGEPVVHWWRSLKNPSPLLMSEEEVYNSSDSFPIEFRDMQQHRKVLYGVDVIAGLEVDPKFYRAQLEHELRAKLFRLRQQAAGMLSDPANLMRLCVDSVSTFCVLGRHALIVAGVETKDDRRSLVTQFGMVMKLNTLPFETLLDIREGKQPASPVGPAELFRWYLDDIQRMVQFVDDLA
ncbi:MAG: nucleotidyltransferase domain-containing protein [Bryobacteraceae bacterium]